MTDDHRPVAIIGCGVIGGGWAARARLHGHDVRAFDPSEQGRRLLEEVHGNALKAWHELGLPEPTVGSLTICDSVEEAVDSVGWVQESVPEVIDLKRDVLATIDASAPPTALVGSSTSGFTCSDLTEALPGADRVVVAHPFNPVYLLPLVEIVGGALTSAATIERATEWYASIGMHPLVVRAEIDAHIADRLLEAVWREALWLVNDGVATTKEIDDAIAYGFGLRWAQMGLFETYRIAGGEGGMAHFIRQFGPALQWPWTKLTDVPELTDELVEAIASQSDAQSGQYSLRELERIRDKNLTGILLALEANRWGAGDALARQRQLLSGDSDSGVAEPPAS